MPDPNKSSANEEEGAQGVAKTSANTTGLW